MENDAPPKLNKPSSFEDNIDVINKVISQNKFRWNIHAICYMDYDDVSQIIRIHIYNKWNQYNPSRPLEPWLNTIINNQIKNIRRNVYDSNSRPCLKCPENQGGDLCAIFNKQCSNCPLYAKWEKTKKRAYDVKLPLPMENHCQEVFDIPHESFDLIKAVKNLHKKMKTILTSKEWKIYDLLYIQELNENEAAKIMGYITRENHRQPGYNNFIRIKKSIMEKANKIKNDIDFF